MLKIILIGAVVVVAAVLGYASTRPDSFRVERSTRIKAPANRIFAMINDLGAFRQWSPYEKLDPGMKRTFSGPAAGVGATYGWEGDSNIGTGSLAIIEADAPGRLAMRLDFLKPFEAHNIAEFTIEPDGDASRVTWAMKGENQFLGKLVGLVFNMDRMVGSQFEEGLANLKQLAEAPAV